MKYLVFSFLISSFVTTTYDPFSYLKMNPKNDYYVIMDSHDTHDGRKLFTVYFPDKKVLDHMYAEEIAISLIEGKWNYNEDIKFK